MCHQEAGTDMEGIRAEDQAAAERFPGPTRCVHGTIDPLGR